MKFLCSNCKAKYQIADEKVSGRTLRMTCRQCKQEIVIRGEVPARASMPHMPAPIVAPPPPAMLSPLAADFQRQLGAGVRASLPPPPPLLDAWHVAINEVPVGPMRREDVARRIQAGAVGPESLAWREGLDDWLPVRQIPELAQLLGGAMPAPQPFVPAMPAQRVEMAPIGGRGGAAPAYSLDDWAPPPPDPATAQALRAPAMTTQVERERGGLRMSGSVMFVVACAFAFLMSALTILGARWLSRSDPAPTDPNAAAAAATTGTTQPTPNGERNAPNEAAGAEADPQEMVIELDDVGMEGETRPNKPGSKGTTTTTPKPKETKTNPNLTDAEKAMLARMGGSTDPQLSNLGAKTNSNRSAGSAQSGGLTADQLSKVVMSGRKNLQRCYEAALRGSGSEDTIRLDVEITVSAAGNVTNVKTGDGGLPGMKECVQRTVKMWRFPSSGDSTQTKFPLVFQPGG
jgi:hypothetical protein